MLSRPIPQWILLGGFVIACSAGAINAVGLLGVHHQALSHMSGPVTLLGSEIAQGESAAALYTIWVIFSFFTGCVLSALILRQEALKLGPDYGIVLLIESAALIAACVLLQRNHPAGGCLAALACGLQNAMATSYSGAVVRTTHMTGIITDLGITAGRALRGDPVDRRRTRLYLVLLSGFVLGGFAGSAAYFKIGYATLLFPATLLGVLGVGYFGFRYLKNPRL